jgi:putative transposase
VCDAVRMTNRRALVTTLRIALRLIGDVFWFATAGFRSRQQLVAENLFLRKQLVLYIERRVKPRRADNATRLALVLLSRTIEWRSFLTVVKPETLIRWHRQAFRLFWRWKSRPVGRPRIPKDVQRLIAQMATANPIWGEERIASELQLKLGLRVSPRTVRRYMPRRPTGRRDSRPGARLCGTMRAPPSPATSS